MPLATLQLAENNISVAQAVELVGALRTGAPGLKELDLSGNPVCGVEEGGKDEFSTDLVEALCAWLQEEGTSLTSLSLADNGITAEGFRSLAQALRSNRTIVVLDLSDNPLGPEGAEVLVPLLEKKDTSLTTLRVSGCELGDAGAKPLMEAMRGSRQLSELLAATLEGWRRLPHQGSAAGGGRKDLFAGVEGLRRDLLGAKHDALGREAGPEAPKAPI